MAGWGGSFRKSFTQSRSSPGNQQGLGSWRPPPFWGTLIVNILRIAKASKGVALYLELSGLVQS